MRATTPADHSHTGGDSRAVVPGRLRHLLAQRLRGKLIGQPGFRRLWFGQTVSGFGSQVTTLALPLTAVLILHVSTFQVGLLTTTGYAAFLLIGLPAGAWERAFMGLNLLWVTLLAGRLART